MLLILHSQARYARRKSQSTKENQTAWYECHHRKFLVQVLGPSSDSLFPSQIAGLFQLKWRIDVTIMTSSMNRLFKPSILVQMTDTNGVIRTFEVSTAMFHHLRMQVARLIKELDATESHPLLTLDKPKPEK